MQWWILVQYDLLLFKKKVKNITPLAPFYKETSIKYNTSSAQESLRGCTGTMHVQDLPFQKEIRYLNSLKLEQFL
jgi:hypothetical protein